MAGGRLTRPRRRFFRLLPAVSTQPLITWMRSRLAPWDPSALINSLTPLPSAPIPQVIPWERRRRSRLLARSGDSASLGLKPQPANMRRAMRGPGGGVDLAPLHGIEMPCRVFSVAHTAASARRGPYPKPVDGIGDRAAGLVGRNGS